MITFIFGRLLDHQSLRVIVVKVAHKTAQVDERLVAGKSALNRTLTRRVSDGPLINYTNKTNT